MLVRHSKSFSILKIKRLCGNAVKFNKSYVQDISDIQCVIFFSQKTGSKSIIPLFPQIKEILDKRGGELPRRPSGQKYNDMVKEVCKLACIDQIIQLTRLEGDRKTPYTLPKYEAVSSHTARRSFVTNMSKLGLTAKQISLMTGHTQQRILDIYDKTKAESNAVAVLDLIKDKF